jgi:hypothetical protein
LAEPALEAHALGDLECRDDAPGSFARPTRLPLGLIEVRNKSVALDWCQLKQDHQFFEGLSRFLYLLNQGRAIHYRETSRCNEAVRVKAPYYTYPANSTPGDQAGLNARSGSEKVLTPHCASLAKNAQPS